MKSINTTVITLILKSSSAYTIKEYSPIACCSVLYKIISKIITARMGKVVRYLVSEEQANFVLGRFIHDNTILAQELIRGYGQKSISARCIIKIDLQKAYDSISWAFVEQILQAYGFPSLFVDWIITCLSSVSYRININGCLTDTFDEKKGLRQGDPISPFLFVLSMDYLSMMMKRLAVQEQFKFHPQCDLLQITHLTFADDLLFFSKGNVHSVSVLLEVFDSFSITSGLKANRNKCEIYFGGVK